MKQRLALARALIHKPPLLFLDEPTSGLDPEAAQQVNDLIAGLSRANGQTVVLATHNLFEAQRLCDRVAVMNKGRILALGSLKGTFSQVMARHLGGHYVSRETEG
jgi:ABC-2 type transport system ATP-binding protein